MTRNIFLLALVLVVALTGAVEAADMKLKNRDLVITTGTGSSTPILVQNAGATEKFSVDTSGNISALGVITVDNTAGGIRWEALSTAYTTNQTANVTVAAMRGGRIDLADGATLTLPSSFTTAVTGAVGYSAIFCAGTAATATITITGGNGGIGATQDVVTLEPGETVEIYVGGDAMWIRGGFGFAAG